MSRPRNKFLLPYDVAKQLKDAGFPQEGSYTSFTLAPKQDPNEPDEFVRLPHLGELIEACGDEFNALHHVTVGFSAGGTRWHENHSDDCENDECPGHHHVEEVGETPERAVAKLYLSLHDNNTN